MNKTQQKVEHVPLVQKIVDARSVATVATDTEKSGNRCHYDPENNIRLARNRADPSKPNLPGPQSTAK